MIINNVLIDNNKYIFSEDGDYNVSFKGANESIDFVVKKNARVNVSIKDFSDKLDVNFFISEGALVKTNFINKNSKNILNLHGILENSAVFNVYFADFSAQNIELNSHVILMGESSSSEFKFSTVSSKDNVKKYYVNFDHIGKSTTSKIEGYGVSQETGVLEIKGISHIEQDSIKSNAEQKVKIILLDKESAGKASPILRIDCDDIKASHACAVGNLNDDHIYYLLSRGISIEEARKLIVFGYLTPIASYFNQDDKEYISKYIEGEF